MSVIDGDTTHYKTADRLCALSLLVTGLVMNIRILGDG